MRTTIAWMLLLSLAGCFEEEAQKPILGPSNPPPVQRDGGFDCYDPQFCDPGMGFDAGVDDCHFSPEGCPIFDDAGVDDCHFSPEGCPVFDDAGVDCFDTPEGCAFDGGVDCASDPEGCPTFDDAGVDCPDCESDAGFDPYA